MLNLNLRCNFFSEQSSGDTVPRTLCIFFPAECKCYINISWFSMIAAIISNFVVFIMLFFRFSKYALTLWSTVCNISQARKNRLLFFFSNSVLFPINSLFTRSISCRCFLITFPYRRLLRTGVLHRGHCFRLITPSSWSIHLRTRRKIRHH